MKDKTDLTFDPLAARPLLIFLLQFKSYIRPGPIGYLNIIQGMRDFQVLKVWSISWLAPFKSPTEEGYEGADEMSINYSLFTNLSKLALNKDASAPAKAIATLKLDQFEKLVAKPSNYGWKWKYYAYLVQQINKFQDGPDEFKVENLLPAPPGQPIGMDDGDFCGN